MPATGKVWSWIKTMLDESLVVLVNQQPKPNIVSQFKRLNPPTFDEATDPSIVEMWIQEMEKAFELIGRNEKQKDMRNDFVAEIECTTANVCIEIEKLFNDVGKSLKDYNSMPFPDDSFMHGLDNRLLSDELSYNKEHEHDEHDKLYKSLNKEQLHAYASIIDSVENGKGVLPIASSGIAATLLPGGRTTHSRFHIPLKVDEYSVAGIKHGTELGELLKHTSLIIWDEAPMQHRHAAKSVDRSLRDIMTSVDPERASLPFGDITIVFGGDFRQILPVIPKASRAQVVSASLNSSKIWDHCRVFLLEKIFIFPLGKQNKKNMKSPNLAGGYLMLVMVPGKEHYYFSQDSLVDSEGDNNDFGSAFPIEYLNSINMPCLPKHHLKIKEGCIEMEPSDTQWPFEFKRVQFPVQLCYAMTINKSQGRSLHKVGLYLPRSVFTHGQLYVAVSRVTSPSGLHILIDSDSGGYTNVTANVIFEEVFYNLPSKDNQNR
ncbi:uncharacterized protein LOC141660823 [Apium graveolens]|uniref:uncharacterized protein LOC141660823 n=1 Tax=Apium graveolens TaxID=4045 RepID=UPI003D79DCD2